MRLVSVAGALALALAIAAAPAAGAARPAPRDPLVREGAITAQVFVLPPHAIEDGFYRELARAGVDAVAIRAFQLERDRPHEGVPADVAAGAWYAAPHVPLAREVLPEHAAAAREAGLRPLAWMTTLSTPLAEDASGHLSHALDPRSGDALPVPRLDPFDPAVGRVLAQVVAALADAGVDGVVLQDDLMLRQLEGASPWALRAWSVASDAEVHPSALFDLDGERVVPGPGFDAWARFKSAALLGLAVRLADAADAARPGFAVVPSLHAETVLQPVHGLRWMAQDLGWAQRLPCAVMAYELQIGEELGVEPAEAGEAVARELASAERLMGGLSRGVAVKVQTIDWRTGRPLPVEEVAAAVLRQRPRAVVLAPADDAARVAAILEAVRDAEASGGLGR